MVQKVENPPIKMDDNYRGTPLFYGNPHIHPQTSCIKNCCFSKEFHMVGQDSQWIQQSFDAVFPPEAPLDRNAFPGVAKARSGHHRATDPALQWELGWNTAVSWCSCDE